MPSPQDGKDETILITLRMPKSLLEVVDRAVELGYFPNRSEAIREALRRLLKSLLFTLEPINVIEQKIKKNPPKRTMPPEVYFMKYALDYITEAPEAEDIFTDYTEFITLTSALLRSGKKEELKEFIKILKEVLK